MRRTRSSPESAVTGWVLLGTGAVLLGGGALAGAEASALSDEYNDALSPVIEGHTYSELEGLRNDAELYDMLAVIGMSAGGAAMLTGAILALGFSDDVPVQVEVTQTGFLTVLGGTF